MAGAYFRFGKVGYSRQDITSAAGTTTLVNTSDYYQYITGSTTQTIKLPAANTMVAAIGFMIVNANSTGDVTVTNDGGTTIATLSPGQTGAFVIDDASSANGVWMILTSGGGGASTTYTATAGENLAANDAVYICNTTSDNGRTVGQAYKLDVTNGYQNEFSGFAIASASAGASATIQVAGELAGFSGVPVGLFIYASLTVPGGFQTTKPNTAVALSVPLGQGSTTTGKVIINGALFATQAGITPANLSASFGYMGGGSTSASSEAVVTSISRIAFATDVYSVISTALPAGRDHAGAVYSSTKGYFCSGLDGSSYTNTIYALTFSGETIATVSATLPTVMYSPSGVQSTTKGYLAGHDDTVIYSLTFSGETTATLAATLSHDTEDARGISSSTAGYVCGGNYSSGKTQINKLLFSNETAADLGTGLPSGRLALMPVWNSTKGYMLGGRDTSGVPTNTIFSILFSNDTVATLGGTLTVNKSNGGMASSLVNGYAVGGQTGAGSGISTEIEKFSFSTETSAANSSSLSTALTTINNGVRV